jgi:hypothetical protein
MASPSVPLVVEGAGGMLRIDRILGSRSELAFSSSVDQFAQRKTLDFVNVAARDLGRRQLLLTTVGGE